jgi:hypothetical protein
MKRRSLFVLVSIFVLAGFAWAQKRTVTNADLDKYKDQRVRAETDLRENYEKLGFPSPDELARREAETVKLRNELAAKLRQEAIDQERIDAQYRTAVAAAYAAQPRQIVVQGGYDDYGFLSYGGYGFGGGFGQAGRFPRVIRGQQTGYYAGGQFWPTPVSVPQRPVPWPGGVRVTPHRR